MSGAAFQNAHGTFFDGEVGAGRPAEAHLDRTGGALRIDTSLGSEIWPLDSVRAVPDQAGDDILVLRRADDPVRRLVLTDRRLLPHLPRAFRRPPVRRRASLARWSAAAILSVGLIVFVLVPILADQLARFIPAEGERALGEVTLTQIRSALDETGFQPVPECNAPAGLAALDAMQARLASALPEPVALSVHVLDHPMVNAFALPGGHVVFFRGLIETAERPEEIAAVFAHELGHVVSRDPTRNALRSAGSIGVLGLLFGDFAGGAIVLFLAERLIDARYSQEAEAAADAYAIALMIDAAIDPAALADMFDRFRKISGETEGVLAHFLSHPQLGDRIAAARDAAPAGFESRPVLPDAAWQALRGICD